MSDARLLTSGRIALSAALAATTFSVAADASWPMARHDPERQGTGVGTSDIVNPVPYWRTYLGGAIGAGQLLTIDAEGTGQLDVILASGGEVVAKRPDNSEIWRGQPLGIASLAGVGDLDGDGTPDIVAFSTRQTFVYSAKTGAVEWTEPYGEMGTIGGVRVGDITGDGRPDVVVVECGCCGVNSGKSGFVWSFGTGFAGATSVASLPVFSCGTSNSVTLLNADNGSGVEMLLADYTHFALLGANGGVLASTGNQGTWTAVNRCSAANIDGVPGDEAICFLNSSDSPATNQRKITVLHYDAAAQPPALNVLWSKVVAPDSGGDMRWVDPVVDLDGDGKYEVVVSTLDPQAGWQTRIFDALTGSEYTPAIGGGEIVVGTAAMETAGKRVLLTSNANAVGITGWDFTSTAQPTTLQKWSLASQSLMAYARPDLVATSTVDTVAVALDLNGDGLDDILTQPAVGGAVAAFSGVAGSPTQLGTLALPTSTEPQYAWVLPASSSGTQIGLARTDGLLNLLDNTLQPTMAGSPPKPTAIQVGGYYAAGGWRDLSSTPRLASFDGGPAEAILVSDSRRALLRFDGATASLAVVPYPTWSVTHTFSPTIAAGLDGSKPAAACLGYQEPVTNPPQYRVRVVRGDGSIEWDAAMASAPLTDLVPGKFNADGTPDFAIQWAKPNDTNLVTRAISGADGSTIWETAPLNPGAGGLQSPGFAVKQWDANAFDDIVFQGSATRVLSGMDGSLLAQGGTKNAYSLPMLADVNGDGSDEVVLTSGFWPTSLYSHDLQTALWTSTDDDRPYPYGSIASCGSSPTSTVLVQGSWANPARLKVTRLSGSSTGTFQTVVLAKGNSYPNETAALAAGAFLGQLTAVNVSAALAGAGHPTAVVGSSDGWLYGVDPCALTLAFAINLGSAVGEPVFGDTDGDGRQEIVVTASDGYLYDIKNENIAAPAYVWDIDPDHGVTDHDVDTIQTTDKLSGSWAAVPGASGYEVTVVTHDHKPLTNPIWKNVGNVTQASLEGLSLTVGEQYVFAVHALSPAGPSVDTLSNGVTVVSASADGGVADGGADAQPDATAIEAGGGDDAGDAGDNNDTGGGASAGCGCRVGGAARGPAGGGLLLALSAVLVGRRRRRQRAIEED